MSLVDTGDEGGAPAPGNLMPSQSPTQWRFLPVSEYVKLDGIEGATRVGRYTSRVQTTSGWMPGSFMGLDRTDFAQVAFWRDDFARDSLGGLMNLLALRYDGALLPRDFMIEHILNVGDRVSIAVPAYGTLTTMPVTIVGSFDYFPSWYPETGPLVVGNLDYFFQEAHGQLPYRVWLDTGEDIDYVQLDTDLWGLNLGAQAVVVAQNRVLREQQRPERQGLLGLLSVGFATAAILTAVGFVLYALFSFRRRSVELGVLRATGLPTGQMAVFVGAELALLLLIGGITGSALGIWASRTFVPYLQIGGDMTARVPPFVVEIAWPALFRLYALFGLLFVVALVILVRLLTQLKLFQAIKLGETV
jgi:putative ABC transport system permease protein